MKPIVLIAIFFLVLMNGVFSTTDDESLPVYLRGLNWGKVEDVVKEDLRLPDAVAPLNYGIDLSVNVRGHDGAAKSDFNGVVTININFTKRTDIIELHSNGLKIEMVELNEAVVLCPPPGVVRFVINKDRETVVIHLNRTIETGEEFLLQISYSGVAMMTEYGLYENWDPKYNKTNDNNGPFVLATNNFPTGARFWFPCFDEPQIKATFQLSVNHPKVLNVFSNSRVQRIDSDTEKRITSVFTKTRALSTYQFSLSVNHFPVDDIGSSHGFERIRIISSVNNPEPLLKEIQRKLVLRNLEYLRNSTSITLENPDSLDVLFLDGTYLITVNPGLITIGRYNCFLNDNVLAGTTPISNFTNLLVGNQLSVRSTDEMWLIDALAMFFANSTPNPVAVRVGVDGGFPDDVMFSSIHERPLRNSASPITTTTNQFLRAKRREPVLKVKALQLLRLVNRLCPSSKLAFEKYIMKNQIVDIDRFMDTVSQHCKDPALIHEIMSDFINQPGKALLTVTRLNDTVHIEQTRYLSTGSNEKLRDTDSAESSLTIKIEQSSTFIIEYQYDRLYHVFYKDTPAYRNISNGLFVTLQYVHRKSLLAALEQGCIAFDDFVEYVKQYIDYGILQYMETFEIFRQATQTLAITEKSEIETEKDRLRTETYLSMLCSDLNLGDVTTWDGLFNNDTSRYWQYSSSRRHKIVITQQNERNMVAKMPCMREWSNSTTYTKFLVENFMGETTRIRPGLVKYLSGRDIGGTNEQWNELHQIFFRSSNKYTDHRWNLLAESVLNVQQNILNKHPKFAKNYFEELRQFIIHNPRRAASMAEQIEMRLEREYIRRERAKSLGVNAEKFFDEFYKSNRRASKKEEEMGLIKPL